MTDAARFGVALAVWIASVLGCAALREAAWLLALFIEPALRMLAGFV